MSQRGSVDEDGKPAAYSRREVVAAVVKTSAAVAATVGGGAYLIGRKTSVAPDLQQIRDHRVRIEDGATQMAIARGLDPAANVAKGIAALGGMQTFVKRGERVVIKPNVGWNRLAEQAANTHPEVVAEVVRQVVAAGASEIWVTDVPVNDAERCFARTGIADAAEAAGAKIVLPDDNAFRTVAVGGQVLRAADVLWPFVEADRVINIPIVKQHSLCAATMAMKNWYGVLGGHRVRLHQKIDQSIVELSAMVKPTLTVMDATRVLMSNGPSGGSLDDVKRFDTVAVGTDEVALDAFGAGFLGKRPDEIGFIREAVKAGLGRADFENLVIEEIAG